jgi:hypothetical protein
MLRIHILNVRTVYAMLSRKTVPVRLCNEQSLLSFSLSLSRSYALLFVKFNFLESFNLIINISLFSPKSNSNEFAFKLIHNLEQVIQKLETQRTSVDREREREKEREKEKYERKINTKNKYEKKRKTRNKIIFILHN